MIKKIPVKLSKEEIENKVIELSKKGMTSEKIGLALEKEGIGKAKKAHGKRIGQILKQHNLYVNPDIENLKKSIENLKKHSQKNKVDQTYKRALLKKEAKLKKLRKMAE